MEELMNILDVSLNYGITVRTLRYYEDMGLLESKRESRTTIRSYDKKDLHKLEQILILRKLDISIKDIKTIYKSNQARVLLNMPDGKVSDINQKIIGLHKLRELVMSFLEQLRTLALSNSGDVGLLLDLVNTFEKEMQTENQYSNTNIEKVQSKELLTMSGVPDVRIIILPACKMVSSGYGSFEDNSFDAFNQWFSKFPINQLEMPKDFLWYDPEKNSSVWWYILSEGLDTKNFAIEEFEGGIYAAAVSKDGDDEDGGRVYGEIKKWVKDSEIFEIDERPKHYTMSHIITMPEMQKILGYSQLEILVPITKKIKSVM